MSLQDNTISFWTLILSLISTILWGVYVIITRKTFLEIKEQTILQSRSFLVAIPETIELTDKNTFITKAKNEHILWKETLEKNLQEAVKQEKCFSLKLINRGKSDITKWKITVNVEIEVGKYLSSKNISGKKFSFIINSTSLQQIGPSDELVINILPYGYFPRANISWVIEYEDIRGNNDTIYENNKYVISNLLAFEYSSNTP